MSGSAAGGSDLLHEQVGRVAVLTLARPPHNFFDVGLITAIADALEAADRTPAVRAVVLRSNQKTFCAGADFGGGKRVEPAPIYEQACRIAARRKPLVAAIRGAAVGGGLGLALTADLRVGCPETRLQANFTRIGLSPGFGISYTLPRVVGQQAATDLLLTARRVGGDDALALRMLDRLVPAEDVDAQAGELAADFAANAPAAVAATRQLLLDGFADRFRQAVARELEQQYPLFAHPDFDEGVRAAAERRLPAFADAAGEALAAAGVAPPHAGAER